MAQATTAQTQPARILGSENTFGRITIFHALIVSMIFAIASIVYHRGGMAHREVETYLPYYLSEKPLLNKLYDSANVEINTYNARELSYLFDYFDCKFIELSASVGHPHFLSITTYCFLIAIGLILWHFSTRVIHLSGLAGLGIISLFWTSPSIFLAGNYFRSSKYGVALAIAILYLLIYKILASKETSDRRFPKSSWLTLFALSWMATLFDRQGVFFICVTVAFLALWHSIYPQKHKFLLLSPFICALILSSVYNHYVGPGLTKLLNHYEANQEFQDMPWFKLWTFPEVFFVEGFDLFIDTLRFMLGCIPSRAIMLILAWFFCKLVIRSRKEKKTIGKIQNETAALWIFVFCNSFLIVLLNTLMLLKQGELSYIDIRRIYYWVPAATFLSFSLAIALSRWNRPKETTKCLLLFVLMIGNIYAIPEHRRIIEHGHLQSCFELSPRLLEALRKLDDRDYQPAADVSNTPIYQYFRDHRTQR